MANEKRLIDANVTKAIIQKEMNKSDFQLFKDVMQCVCNILDHSDTVDAVEVVRCKDCKHFWESFSGTHSCKLHKGLVGTKYDTFCSYGERKGDGNV